MNVYQAVTIASIVQAEADRRAGHGQGRPGRLQPAGARDAAADGLHDQLRAEPVHAETRQPSDTRINSPYNSYQRMGLPPTPIDNPGEEAMRAAINPTPGDWLYFVTVKPGDTRFTADYAGTPAQRRRVQPEPEEPAGTEEKPGGVA